MATHSSILAWEIPLTEDPGGLDSIGVINSWTWPGDYACVRAHTHTTHTQYLTYYCEF